MWIIEVLLNPCPELFNKVKYWESWFKWNMKTVFISINHVLIQFNFPVVSTQIYKSIAKVIFIFKCKDRLLHRIDYLESWTFAPTNRK